MPATAVSACGLRCDDCSDRATALETLASAPADVVETLSDREAANCCRATGDDDRPMNLDTVRDTYRRMIDDVGVPVRIRRYTGLGINRPRFDLEIRARVTGYAPDELVGGIVQGDRRVIFLVEDLIAKQWPDGVTILASHKLVVREKELAIIAPDDSTRRIGNPAIAYDLTARG